jgi:hypothetical protein
MNTEELYNYFQDLTDGEEFLSTEAALRTLNDGYNQLLAERDWIFLRKGATLPVVNKEVDLSLIEDFGSLRFLYRPGETEPLRKANWDQRFNTEYDYYHDVASKKLVFINEAPTSAIVDYKYKPAALEFEDESMPVFEKDFHPLVSLFAVKNFKKLDETQDFYMESEVDRRNMLYNMIDHYVAQEQHYG